MEGISWNLAIQRLSIQRRTGLPAVLPRRQREARDPANGWQSIPVRDIDHARRVVFLVREQLWKLRFMLAHDCHNLPSMSDAEVTEQVAAMLTRGELVLLEHRLMEAGKSSLSGIPAASNTSVSSTMTLRTLRPATQQQRLPTSTSTAEVRQPRSHKAASQSRMEPSHQDAQAAVLRLAAAEGTPFCEICDRRARTRQEMGARRGAA